MRVPSTNRGHNSINKSVIRDFFTKEKKMNYQNDPISECMTEIDIINFYDKHMGYAQSLFQEIKNLETTPTNELTWDLTLGKVDYIRLELSMISCISEFLSLVHPNKDIRKLAKSFEPEVEKFLGKIMFDSVFVSLIKRYATNAKITGIHARMLKDILRDFQRNGLNLSLEERQQLSLINEELSSLEQDFMSNIIEEQLSILIQPEQLKGLPENFIQQHTLTNEGQVLLTTDYSDYQSIISYAEDRSVAKLLNYQFYNRAIKNLKVLDRILELKNKKAKLLGYKTWADYAIEPKMAKDSKTVQKFLDDLSSTIDESARIEYQKLLLEREQLNYISDKSPIASQDCPYLFQKIRERNSGLDIKTLNEYFEINCVIKGILSLIEQMFNLSLRKNSTVSKWNSDIEVIDVYDEDKWCGRIYLDLYIREGKYKHSAMFHIRDGKLLSNGHYLEPIVAIICNYSKPNNGSTLLTHSNVVSLFHEFGHVLHNILTRQSLITYSGSNTARDFVEVPSQVFEAFAYQKDIIDSFARHYQTGNHIPDEFFTSMNYNSFGRAIYNQRQLALSILDLTYHQHQYPFDTDEIFHEVMNKSQPFFYDPETHFQASFHHLINYDAGYYGYQWSAVITQDILSRFEKEGFDNKKVISDWRKFVLEVGAGDDENLILERFLGRPYNFEAFKKSFYNKASDELPPPKNK